jgi:serine/threonine protein kinase
VFLAQNRLDRHTYAIKKVALDYHSISDTRRTIREAENLSKMHHVNIVRYYQSWI